MKPNSTKRAHDLFGKRGTIAANSVVMTLHKLCLPGIVVVLILMRTHGTQAQSTQSAPSAERPESSFANRPLSIEAQLAVYGPVGVLGAIISYAPIPYVVLSVGGGLSGTGFENQGWRAGVGIQGRLPYRPNRALSMDAWYSLGPDRTFEAGFEGASTYYWHLAHWVQAHLGHEWRSDSGVTLRIFGGVTAVLKRGRPNHCRGDSCSVFSEDEPAALLPSLGIAVGYAFGR